MGKMAGRALYRALGNDVHVVRAFAHPTSDERLHRSDAIAFCRRAAVSGEAEVIMPITLSTSGPGTGATSSLVLAPSARNCLSVVSAANALRNAAIRSAGTPGGAIIGRATVFCVR